MTIVRIMSGNTCKILRYQRRTLPSDLHDFYPWEPVKLKLQKHWPHGPHAGTPQEMDWLRDVMAAAVVLGEIDGTARFSFVIFNDKVHLKARPARGTATAAAQ